MKRASGILLPIFSLPSERGKGDLGPEAYKFIDRLEQAGQRYWQVLPLGPVNDKDCPYQSTSAFAGEPSFISPEKLADKGLLDKGELELPREEALKRAWENFKEQEASSTADLEEFCRQEKAWLDDYALYCALSDHFGDGDWSIWDRDIARREPEDMEHWSEKLAAEADFYRWTQFEFFSQWDELLGHAHEKGIEIIGDVPYYAAFESADCWARPDLFSVDKEGRQLMSAGAPPDYFAPEGQCWDNPLYDWEAHKAEDFRWWRDRIDQQFRFFDVLRIDHMRGFESYYAIDTASADATKGHWEKGPGMDFFRALEKDFPGRRFIAEDLGYLTPEVTEMLAATGYPGMKVLQFAFDTSEENVYLPFNYDSDNYVVYTGTHDNDTSQGWYEKAEDWKKDFVSWYLREKSQVLDAKARDGEDAAAVVTETTGADGEATAPLDPEIAVRGLIRLAQSSRCDTCIIPMQDYLLVGSEARINLPGTAEGNWRWQMEKDAFSEELAREIAEISAKYDR